MVLLLFKEHRKQWVKLHSTQSISLPGVLQNVILLPLLYLLLINNAPFPLLHTKLLIFADYIKMFMFNLIGCELLQEDLNRLSFMGGNFELET